MKITETNRYKEILKEIKEKQINIDFLTALKNSECGKRIEKFCNNKDCDFTPTEEYKDCIEFDDEDKDKAIIVRVPITKTRFFYGKKANGHNGYDIDEDINRWEYFLSDCLEDKKKFDRCTLDISIDDAREFYNEILSKFQREDLFIVSHRDIDDYSVEGYLKMQACIKYGFAYKYFSNPDNFMVVEGRQLYIIDGEIYKASQREIEAYCKATGKTAKKVEPKYLRGME